MTQKVHGAAYPGIWVERQVTFAKAIFNTNIAALPAAALTVLGTATPAGVGTIADSSFDVVESALVQALKTLATRATILGISKQATLAYASAAGATSSGSVITVGTTTGLFVGMTVTVTAGVGAFPAGTTVLAITGGTTFVSSAAPSTPLSGGASVVTGSGVSVDVMLGFAEGWFSDASGVIGTVLPVIGAQARVTTAGAAPTDEVGEIVSVVDTAVTFSLQFAYMDGKMAIGTLANGALAIGPGATPGNIPAPGNTPTGTPGYYPVSDPA